MRELKYKIGAGLLTVIVSGFGALNALAQSTSSLTWSGTDTDEVVGPAFTSWKTYIKWFLIFGIPILIALYWLGRGLGLFRGQG